MPRRFHNLWAAIATMMCVAALVLWIRGRSVNDEVYLNLHSHLVIAGSFPNHLDLIFYRQANYRGPVVRILGGDKRVPSKPEYWSFRINVNAYRLEIRAPWWVLLVVGSMVPVLGISRIVRHRRNVRLGLCARCGYDLRATSGRCPECGESPAVSRSGKPPANTAEMGTNSP